MGGLGGIGDYSVSKRQAVKGFSQIIEPPPFFPFIYCHSYSSHSRHRMLGRMYGMCDLQQLEEMSADWGISPLKYDQSLQMSVVPVWKDAARYPIETGHSARGRGWNMSENYIEKA